MRKSGGGLLPGQQAEGLGKAARPADSGMWKLIKGRRASPPHRCQSTPTGLLQSRVHTHTLWTTLLCVRSCVYVSVCECVRAHSRVHICLCCCCVCVLHTPLPPLKAHTNSIAVRGAGFLGNTGALGSTALGGALKGALARVTDPFT